MTVSCGCQRCRTWRLLRLPGGCSSLWRLPAELGSVHRQIWSPAPGDGLGFAVDCSRWQS